MTSILLKVQKTHFTGKANVYICISCSRAYISCSREFLQDEIGYVRSQLKGNGYPIKLINNEIDKVR